MGQGRHVTYLGQSRGQCQSLSTNVCRHIQNKSPQLAYSENFMHQLRERIYLPNQLKIA